MSTKDQTEKQFAGELKDPEPNPHHVPTAAIITASDDTSQPFLGNIKTTAETGFSEQAPPSANPSDYSPSQIYSPGPIPYRGGDDVHLYFTSANRSVADPDGESDPRSAPTSSELPHYRDHRGIDLAAQRMNAQLPSKSTSKSSSNILTISKAEAELDEAFLGLRVIDPATMDPAVDYSFDQTNRHLEDSCDLTPPVTVEPLSSTRSIAAVASSAGAAGTSAVRKMVAKARLSKEPQPDAPSLSADRDFARALPGPASLPQTGTFTLRSDVKKQTMIAVGFSNAFYTNYWHTAHPYSREIYNLMLGDLKPSILRIRNHYGINAASNMTIDVEFLNLATQILGYRPTVLMSSWSPPAYMKASGQLNGANANPKVPITDVLAKDANGKFRYADYAKYWVDSLKSYAALGLRPDYFSPQNEPNYSGFGSPTCLFGALETKNIPGYFQATELVYNEVQKAIKPPPKMIGPEGTGLDSYIPEFPLGGAGRFVAIANHLYGSGQFGRPIFDPYSFTPALIRAKSLANQKGIQNIWMTEFAKLSAFEYQDPLRMSILIHNTLTLADVSVYLHWDGAWGTPDVGQPTEGTLLLVENPFRDRTKWLFPRGYKILHSFYWFKHFTRFVRPTYRRMQCDSSGLGNVLISAWLGPRGEYSMIFINTGLVQANITLQGLLQQNPLQVTDRYFSTLDVAFTNAGRFHGKLLSIPPRSITTLFTYQP